MSFNQESNFGLNRRGFLAASLAGVATFSTGNLKAEKIKKKARVSITFDLEMSRHYPKRDFMEWDFQKGNLNEPTKKYALEAAKIVKDLGGLIHYFCVGRVLEQKNIEWLKEIHQMGHAIGNHTYDHVNIWAKDSLKTQFRFQRSPWLIKGMSAEQIIRQNIRMTTLGMKERLGFSPDGFRSPGGSYKALDGREDVQQIILDEGFKWISSRYPQHLYSKRGEEPTGEIFESIVKAMEISQPEVYPTGLVEIPMSPIGDVGAFRNSSWKMKHFLKSIKLCIDWAIENGGIFDFLCHPSIMYVEDPGFETVKYICDLVKKSNGKAEIVTLGSIAKDYIK
jgi:peptidoglycan/xylan/chitin deacetylase (PgdA/CDA1 family)